MPLGASQLGEQTGERGVWSESNRLTTKGQATSDGSPAIKLARSLVGQAQERTLGRHGPGLWLTFRTDKRVPRSF